MIERKDWRTHGVASHLIVQNDCRYRLSTVVGAVVVSTVGDYHPEHKGADSKPETIGYDRFYETMVFPIAGARKCDGGGACSCQGMPEINVARQLDFNGYATAIEASAGHDAMCVSWSNDEKQAEAVAPLEPE